ncbi:porin family protein [Flavobacterium sp. 25HG05S-40]|uniref:porin family protein n=1 Tax=Flavobacterium sp. 25HG05S-40 TaxID=3458682 RepID=UPI004043D561
MKKIILVMTILCVGIIQAQQREKGTIEIFPHIGFTISDFSGSDAGNDGEVSSLNIGVGTDYYLNSRWSIRSGLHYQTMGSDIDDTILGLSYLTLPLNANWHFGKTRKWNLNFGPSVGFLTYAKLGDVDVKDNFNKFQVGLNVGIGYKFELTKKVSLLIDYQGMAGLSNAEKDLNVKNNYGSLNVGAVFKL